MKKVIFIIYFQLLFLSAIFSQIWPKTYPQWSGSHVESLIEAYDKGYMFLLGPATLSYKFAIVVKTDINGNVLWNKYIGNGQYVLSIGQIEETLDHGFVFCSGIGKYDNTGYFDPVLIKFTPCGDLEWCSVISTPGLYDFADRVRQTSEGDYILLTSYSDPNPQNRIQIYKFNNTGGLLWKHNYPGDSIIFDEDGYDLKVLNDGYLISGLCFSPDSGQTGGGYERPYYIKTDTAGNEMWRLAYGRGNGFHGAPFPIYHVLTNSSGSIYNAGWHSNYCDTPSLFKCSGDGAESYFQDMIPNVCPGGNGELNWLDDTTIAIAAGGILNSNLIAKWMKLDTFGIEKYSKYFTDPYILNSNNPLTVITFDKKIVTVEDYNLLAYLYKLNENFDFDSIYTHQYTYDSLCPHQIVSDTIDPNCNLIVGIDNPKLENSSSSLKVYPNPSINQLNVEFPKVLIISSGSGKYRSTKEIYQWKSTILEIYDFQGKKFLEKEIIKSLDHLELDVSIWQRGLYYFRLVYEKQTVDGAKVVVN